MKQIKEETENFRKFRQEKEKEVTQLKAKVCEPFSAVKKWKL